MIRRAQPKRWIAAASIVLALGCVTGGHTMLRSGPITASDPAHVQYISVDTAGVLSRPYEQIAVVSAQAHWNTPERFFISALRKEGAKVGADAVVLTGFESLGATNVYYALAIRWK